MDGYEVAKAFEKGELCGWAETRHPGLAASEFRVIGSSFVPATIVGQTRPTAGRKAFLWQVVRKVLGADTPNYPQEIGDCVSFGAKNAIEYLQCCEVLMGGERQKFEPVFPPYLYGTGRVYVGRGQLGNDDGSLGSWMAEAVKKYGVLFSKEDGVPDYSGRVAKAWGDPRPGPDLDKWRPTGEKFPVKSAALISTWDELVAAIVNGYPVTTASNVGYDMQPSRDGFHRQTANWSHQMVWVGADDNDRDPYAVLLNSWGDVHGRLKDFETGEEYPAGTLRVRRSDVEKHLRERESFAFSQFEGLREQEIEKELFRIIGA